MKPILSIDQLSIFYNQQCAVEKVLLGFLPRQVTAIIGPSGCGKSSLLRSCNRLNDLIPNIVVKGKVFYKGQNIYAPETDAVQIRRQIGMVFQRPNPFPKSIYENIAFGARINGFRGNMNNLVEEALQRAALWQEVKDKLHQPSSELSGGQQQRLCIARAIALQPEVILMDEPCSALDPIATDKIEELIHNLKEQFTIVIVTHNLQQARRISDYTAFFNVVINEGARVGKLIEYGSTIDVFTNPQQEATQNYIAGRFG